MAGGRFSIQGAFRLTDRMTRPIARIQGRISKMTRSASRGVRSMDRAFSKANSTISRTGMAVGAAALATTLALGAMGKSGADFEQAITNVGAVGLQTRAQIAPLEAEALRLGETTKFNAIEAANAMEIMAKSGFSAQDTLSGVGGVLSAAAASGLEIAEVADHVSKALKGMGMETSQAGRVADVLALASSRTNSTIGTLGESLSNVSSTASDLGIDIEDVVASVALLQDVGLDASVAGSAMNTMLTKMAAPSASVAAKMKQLGITFKDGHGNMLPFQEAIANISKGAQRAGGNFDKVAFLAELVGLRGQKAAGNLAKLFDNKKLQKLTADLGEAKGVAEQMAKLRMDTLEGDLTLLGSVVDSVKIALFGLKGGKLREVVQSVTEWVSANKDLIVSGVGDFLQGISDNLPAIVRGLKLIGGSLAVFYAWGAAVKIAGAAMAAFNVIMALNPIGATILALAALGAVMYVFWDKIGPWAEDAWKAVVTAFDGAVSWIKGALQATGEFILGVFTALFPSIASLAATAIRAVVDNWGSIKGFFSGLWEFVTATASAAIEKLAAVLQPIADIFQSVWDTVAAAFESTVGWIFGAISKAISDVRSLGRGTASAALGDGDSGSSGQSHARQVVGPERMTASSVSESIRTERNMSELTIRDESGRAEMTRQPKRGAPISILASGAF